MARRRILVALALAALAAGAAVLLWRDDPATSSLFPPCPVRALTGLYCPGCGALRALHRLLHGQLAAAFRMNPVVVVLAPLVLFGLAQQAFPRLAPRWSADRTSTRSVWLVLGLVIAFGVLRNVPFEPFSLLAPHGSVDAPSHQPEPTHRPRLTPRSP